jgi:phytoene dehydrogenase-like protein
VVTPSSSSEVTQPAPTSGSNGPSAQPASGYDYVIVGAGMGGLTVGALLAKAGARVAVVEAHEYPGGCCHTFPMGDYRFCAAVHYIFSCGEGEPVYNLLRALGLHEKVTFERLNDDGYDHFRCPSAGLSFRIPSGLDAWCKRLSEQFPAETKAITSFFETIKTLAKELGRLPDNLSGLRILKGLVAAPHVALYRASTLQHLFDKLKLSAPVQAILSTQLGDAGLPPRDHSLLLYVALVSKYCAGAYYPTNHFASLIDGVANAITSSPGCDIFYNTEVARVRMEHGRVAAVVSADGREFRGEKVICNADPKWFVQQIGEEHFPSEYKKRVNYEYSASSFSLYLGVRGIDLRDHGYGNWNVWHYPSLDINATYDAQHERDDLDNPWLFMSTPGLCSPNATTRHAPEGEQILELITTCAYRPFDARSERDRKEYTRRKVAIRDRLIATVQEHYVPNLRKHLVMKVAGTPTTNKRYLWAPQGNIYGSALTPKNISATRLKAKSPIENLFFTGASAGYPSIGGTVGAGIRLFNELTGRK